MNISLSDCLLGVRHSASCCGSSGGGFFAVCSVACIVEALDPGLGNGAGPQCLVVHGHPHSAVTAQETTPGNAAGSAYHAAVQ